MTQRQRKTMALRWFGLSLLLSALALLPLQGRPQEDWFRTGTGLGMEKIRLALPPFTAQSQPVETVAGVFNSVLWNDLERHPGTGQPQLSPPVGSNHPRDP
jgi:hypothetical protein